MSVTCSDPVLRGDGCWNVYLDVGSNVGVQIRKLFEPRRYMAAPAQRVYSRFFGAHAAERREHTCALGIEANPRHAARLRQVQDRYNELGWRTRILTNAAVGTNESSATTFWLDNSHDPLAKGSEWWASTVRTKMQRGNGSQWEHATVQTVNLLEWLRCILSRKLPPAPALSGGATMRAAPRVVMKLDIEGGEYAVLPPLITQGVLCQLDYAWTEVHDGQSQEHGALARAAGLPKQLVAGGFRRTFRWLMQAASVAPGCRVVVHDDSDESFVQDPFLLPPPPNATTRRGEASVVHVANKEGSSSRRGAKILVAVITDSGEVTLSRLWENMRVADQSYAAHRVLMHWAVCTYDDAAMAWEPVRKRAASSLRRVRLVEAINATLPGVRSRSETVRLSPSWRKARTALHERLLRAVWARVGQEAYDAVWTLDADLSFHGFDLPEFLRRWRCTFRAGPPVISQPLIRQNTQVWPFNHKTYTAATCEHLSKRVGSPSPRCVFSQTLALRIAFIEGQSALVDARFLAWLFELRLIRKVLDLQLHLGVEWGIDSIWCAAAAEWAPQRTPCAVLTVPLDHDNTRSMDAKGGRHAIHGFRLLAHAGLRSRLQLGCKGNCSTHPWYRMQPTPAWKLPKTARDIEDVAACAVTEGDTEEGDCGAGRGGTKAATTTKPAANSRCDELVRLCGASHCTV